MANISIRRSIRWLPNPASEPTSTVVLTSPQRRFVDVRVLKTADEATGNDLDWAFAGTSSSTPLEDGEKTKGEWRHWVSNRTAHPDGEVDAGINTPQPDGSTLETGSMVNPATGSVGDYEEVWEDGPLDVPGQPATADKRCLLLRLDNGPTNRGVVLRLGGYCQGIARTGAEGVTVERWEWESTSSQWKKTYQFGNGVLPCEEILSDASAALKEGSVVKDSKGHVWKVEEAVRVDQSGIANIAMKL